MNNFVARANIDHYLELLNNRDVPARNTSMIVKLLIEEENKLSHDIEQLEFAENKAATCRHRVERQKRLRDCFANGSTEQIEAERLVINFTATLTLVESFCSHLRKKVDANRL